MHLPDRQLRRVADNKTPGIFQGAAFSLTFRRPQSCAAELELNFDRRGRYREESFGLSTRFPFAFLAKTRRVPLRREIIVYPPVEPTDEYFEILPMITGEFETFARGRGYDLYRIREYLPEDSARHVDWKATAKSGSLKVREFGREDERKLRIVFDNPAPGPFLKGPTKMPSRWRPRWDGILARAIQRFPTSLPAMKETLTSITF